MNGSFKARLTPNHFSATQGWTVNQFVQRPEGETPGDVGLCLSGGGSRAMSAGMGQLRGLAHLQLNGKSLLSQTKAISTVSGGSWVGVPYVYLTASTSDTDYLNGYVADQGQLVPTPTAGHPQDEVLNQLPDGNIGNAVTTDFSLIDLALEAVSLWLEGTPADFLWQALMGKHILEPYGLYIPGQDSQPTSLFSYDATVLQKDVTGPNPSLVGEKVDLVASGPNHGARPYLICNTAMFLEQPGVAFEQLAPVQATPFVTGILGRPAPGMDANGLVPGGGGVSSFAFNSNPTQVTNADIVVDQERQFALADIVGASSAAFAEKLENIFSDWRKNPEDFRRELMKRSSPLANQLKSSDKLSAEVSDALTALQDVIPQYRYWPVLNARPATETKPTRFADAGSLENSGVGGMLAYSDVRNLISCLNTSTPLTCDADRGMIDGHGNEVPNTRVVVAEMVPPLFGYQPYTSGEGYKLYQGDSNPTYPQGKNSQVFPPENFADVLQGLWGAQQSGKGAVFLQSGLEVSTNAWFGIQGGRLVNVLWVYLSSTPQWRGLLSGEVRQILDSSDFSDFPHYSTFDTELNATQINLLANLTAWTVAGDENKKQFFAMYDDR